MPSQPKLQQQFKKIEDEVKNKASSYAVNQMFLAIENVIKQVLELKRKTSEKKN